MNEKKYSLSELDQMRAAVARKHGFGNIVGWHDPMQHATYVHHTTAAIEQLLRTYMQNGTTPEELEADGESVETGA